MKDVLVVIVYYFVSVSINRILGATVTSFVGFSMSVIFGATSRTTAGQDATLSSSGARAVSRWGRKCVLELRANATSHCALCNRRDMHTWQKDAEDDCID